MAERLYEFEESKSFEYYPSFLENKKFRDVALVSFQSLEYTDIDSTQLAKINFTIIGARIVQDEIEVIISHDQFRRDSKNNEILTFPSSEYQIPEVILVGKLKIGFKTGQKDPLYIVIPNPFWDNKKDKRTLLYVKIRDL